MSFKIYASEEIREEIDSVKAYDDAKTEDDEIIPFEQAVEEIETRRNDLKK
jgi:hypothetical protein